MRSGVPMNNLTMTTRDGLLCDEGMNGLLQSRTVNDLVVHSHLTTLVTNDKDTNATTTIVKVLTQTSKKIALVKDRQALLDVASLSHGNYVSILTDVEDAVLLEDRTEHVLNNDGGGWIGNEARLLVELLGEEVDTQVAMLACLRGGGDADDLARATLKDQEIANADVVAGDGNGVGRHVGCRGSPGSGVTLGSGVIDFCVGLTRDRRGLVGFFDYDFLPVVVGVVVVTWTVNWVEDAVGSFV